VYLPATTLDGRTAGITFDKPLNPDSATVIKHFFIEGTRLRAASLTECGKTVVLHLDDPLEGTNITITHLKDAAGNPFRQLTLPIYELGWTVTDIGEPAEQSFCFARDPGSIEVRCGGNTIWQEADTFTFVHKKVQGDFDVQV